MQLVRNTRAFESIKMALRKMFGTLMISLLMSAVTSSNFRDETENGENTFKGLRGLSSASASSTRPIIFTFYDGEASDETEEQVILSIWKDEWQNAGWVTRILTLEDARQHPHFQTFNSMLDKSEKMKKPDVSLLFVSFDRKTLNKFVI